MSIQKRLFSRDEDIKNFYKPENLELLYIYFSKGYFNHLSLF